jgi:hypothetical protein
MCITGTRMRIKEYGELEDGTWYSRELKITESMEMEGDSTVTREVAEERTKIGGEMLKVKVVRVDGEMTAQEVDDTDVRDVTQFERKLEEVNRKWKRGHHGPALSNMYK